MASFLQPNARDPKNKFSKFLLMTHADTSKQIKRENPFEIHKAIMNIIPKKSYFKMKPTGPGHLLIEVDKKETHDKLLQVKKLNSNKISVSVNIKPHAFLNTCKGTIYCENIPNMTNEQIMEELKDQDVCEVYRTKRRDGDVYIPTSLFIITFDKTTLPNEVRVGYLNCKVRVYIPNPRICFKCQKFGHGQNTCSHDPVCSKCNHVGPDHPKFQDCTNDLKCANCHGDHPASSRQCPMYMLEKKIMERKIRQNLTYPQARDQIYNEQPELVSKVPTLKFKKAPQTYSSVTANPSATDLYQQQAKLIIDQQQQMKQMQQQIIVLTNLIKDQVNKTQMPSTSKDTLSVAEVQSAKRPLRTDSASSDEAASHEEDSLPQTGGKRVCNHEKEEKMEAPPPVDVKSGRSVKPLNSSRSSSADPDRRVMEMVRTGSSGPTVDKGGTVSKIPKKTPKLITGPVTKPKGN